MKEIHTQDDVEKIKLGEVIWLDGKIVTLQKNTCSNCVFHKIRQRPNGATSECTMSFYCNVLTGSVTFWKYSFEEIKGGL